MTERQKAKLEVYEGIFDSYIHNILWYHSLVTRNLEDGDYTAAQKWQNRMAVFVRMLDEFMQKEVDAFLADNEWSYNTEAELADVE